MTERIYGRPTINGDEVDAFAPRYRRSTRLDRAGVRVKTKRNCCKRERRQARQKLRQYR